MARKVHSRYVITGTLVAKSPLHIGGVHNDPIVDLTLAVNGAGDYYIPGTSLAGSLRSWMEELEEDQDITGKLWGPRLGQTGRNRSDEGHASWVIVDDAVIQGKVQAELRDGVGIDRLYGSAAEHIKFDRAILPKGSKLNLRVTLERVMEHCLSLTDAEWQAICESWAELLQALQNGEFSLGAAKTRGLGTVILEDLKVIEQQLNSPAGILALLRKEESQSSIFDSANNRTPKPRSRLLITIDWEPLSPLMVKAEREGIAVDMLPLVSSIDGDRVAFVLPGSSIKGALRTQAERIVRTVLNREVPKLVDSKQAFLQQLEVPLIDELFGKAAKTEQGQQKGCIGALAVEDCYADQSISPEHWEKVQTAEESPELLTALSNAGLSKTQQAFHVAIDRWTGGAADGFLYSTLEPLGVKWHPMKLKLNLYRLEGEDQQKQCVALLLFVLRDLVQGRIPLGYGVNRGMGEIAIHSIKLEGLSSLNLNTEDSVTLANGDLTALNQSVLKKLENSWCAWIESCSGDVSHAYS
jgi:CRISPR/Cas system CSM-associated protein Csm3 (group 7 of RAMP superfamily)